MCAPPGGHSGARTHTHTHTHAHTRTQHGPGSGGRHTWPGTRCGSLHLRTHSAGAPGADGCASAAAASCALTHTHAHGRCHGPGSKLPQRVGGIVGRIAPAMRTHARTHAHTHTPHTRGTHTRTHAHNTRLLACGLDAHFAQIPALAC